MRREYIGEFDVDGMIILR